MVPHNGAAPGSTLALREAVAAVKCAEAITEQSLDDVNGAAPGWWSCRLSLHFPDAVACG
jgi:hypothetical protein